MLSRVPPAAKGGCGSETLLVTRPVRRYHASNGAPFAKRHRAPCFNCLWRQTSPLNTDR